MLGIYNYGRRCSEEGFKSGQKQTIIAYQGGYVVGTYPDTLHLVTAEKYNLPKLRLPFGLLKNPVVHENGQFYGEFDEDEGIPLTLKTTPAPSSASAAEPRKTYRIVIPPLPE